MLKLFLKLILIIALVSSIIYCRFYGRGVQEDVAISLNISDVDSLGAKRVVDSLVMPHIKNKVAFKIYAQHLNLYERGVIRGYYELNKSMSVVEVVRRLKLGMQTPKKITFGVVRTMEHLARQLDNQLQADSTAFLEAIENPEWRKPLGLSYEERYSIFIPNTYEVWWSITPDSFVERMVHEYESFWTPEREQKRKALNLSRAEVMTLASIVIEESRLESEFGRIAGVYLNRLRRGMKLQADPTVKFALGDISIKRVLNTHLKYDSPYNTYVYKGLPPGPIALPTIAAIDSVLNAEKHTYLFFCARPEMDGGHNFATSYNEHLKNARLYQAELNRRKIM